MKKLLFFILFNLGANLSYAQTPELALLLSTECKEFIKSIESQYTYDWLTVPVNYANTESEQKLKIFYYYKKTEKFRNPILFFNGGPGFSSHSSAPLFAASQKKFELAATYNFIFMDQRGTGCSSPSLPMGAEPETFENLKWYASLGIVNDAELLRAKLLGAKTKWKIFGQSYGAYTVYRYIEKFPQFISKAYAHGYAVGNKDYDNSYFRILSQYQVTEKYLKLFADDRVRLAILNQHLSNPNKCYKNSLGIEMCGYENLSPFVYLLGFKGNWKYVHIYLNRIVPDKIIDEQALINHVAQNVDQNFFYRNTQSVENISQTMTFFLNFAGLYDWDTTPIDFAKCTQIYTHLKEQYKLTPEKLLLNECQAPLQFSYVDTVSSFIRSKIDLSMPQFVDIKTVLKNISTYKLPVYSYSGEYDCFIPKQFFNLQIKTFGSKVIYKNLENSGHEGFYTEKQIFLDLVK